jgi:hypothetical protein
MSDRSRLGMGRGRKAPPLQQALITKKRVVAPATKRLWATHRMGFDLPVAFGGFKKNFTGSPQTFKQMSNNAYALLAVLTRQIETMPDNKIFRVSLSDIYCFDALNNQMAGVDRALEETKFALQSIGGLCRRHGIYLFMVFDMAPQDRVVNSLFWFTFLRRLWAIIVSDLFINTSSFRISIPYSFIQKNLGFLTNRGVFKVDELLELKTMALLIDVRLSKSELQRHVNSCVRVGIQIQIQLETIKKCFTWIKEHDLQLQRTFGILFILRVEIEKLTKKEIRNTREKYAKLSRYADTLFVRKI